MKEELKDYREPRVYEYITKDVTTVSPDASVEEAARIMKTTGETGLFVVDVDNKILGVITTLDLLLQPMNKKISDIMQKKVLAVSPDAKISTAARIMFREGISRLAVVDENKRLVGVITTKDIIRASIERVTPAKVRSMKKILEETHKIKVKVKRGKVKIAELIPTQPEIYIDELKGREYELKKGLAEPILVAISKGKHYVLIDGHHRVVAARNLGMEEIDAYILIPDKPIELGIEKTARKLGLNKIEDVKIVDKEPPEQFPIRII